MRDAFSDGLFTRLAREAHPVDLMCLYLLHGSADRIPGLMAGQGALSFEHLSRHVRPAHHWRHEDADTFSLPVRRKVRGRPYGLEFRLHFLGGEPYADALVPFGAAVDLPRFLHHFRTHHASGDWDFDVHTDRRDLRESVLRFANGRELWFQINRGPVVAGHARPVPWQRHRLLTGRLQGNLFGPGPHPPTAGSAAFPDPHHTVEPTTPGARAHRRHVARLYDPLPLLPARPPRPEFGTRPRRR
ncbi:hypothetical protein ACIA8O_22270 [Kitasatospora sp. NPDC051853]|uniref:hypothetical protein n=1 Tax=Kitasatospora sp. NPDC051853 TaxID=3364058 RepID=UPI0037A0AFF9